MKPPPRARTKPDRNLKPESRPQCSGKLVCKWQRAEKKKLLDALKRLSRTSGSDGDIDYAFLRKYVPTRSISEVHAMVESLKNKVISCANFKLKKGWEEKRLRKPIEVWTDMASAVAGTFEEPISTAFSQMLIVSSTEPCTLRNCDPPQVHRPPTDKDRPVGLTVPLRPMPRLQVQGKCVGRNAARPLQVVKTPAPTMDPGVRVPNSKIPPPTTPETSPAATSTSQSAVTSCQPGAAKILVGPFASPQLASQAVTPVMGSSSATSLTPVPNTTPSSVASCSSATSSCSSNCSTPPLSTPATAFHARFGRTSKYATSDSPRMFGVKCVVNFEKIYRYLSAIHQPNEECHLTPMESAIVLDLLMSLPEELRLLDCNKLHKHLIQVYQCLSSSADSKLARTLFKDLKDEISAQTEAPSSQHGIRTSSQQNTAETADGTGSGGQKLQAHEAESQPSGNNNTSNQSGDTDVMELCPPLNPFMVPLKLLMRRKVAVPNL